MYAMVVKFYDGILVFFFSLLFLLLVLPRFACENYILFIYIRVVSHRNRQNIEVIFLHSQLLFYFHLSIQLQSCWDCVSVPVFCFYSLAFFSKYLIYIYFDICLWILAKFSWIYALHFLLFLLFFSSSVFLTFSQVLFFFALLLLVLDAVYLLAKMFGITPYCKNLLNKQLLLNNTSNEENWRVWKHTHPCWVVHWIKAQFVLNILAFFFSTTSRNQN